MASASAKNRIRRPAFTLLELLVVVALIGVLLAVLLPALNGVWKGASRAQCMVHLYQIGQAVGVRSSDEHMREDSPINPPSWPSQLIGYLENQADVLLCPEGGATLSAADPAQKAEFRVETPSGTYYTPLEEGRWMIKFSNTQYEDAKSKGLLNNDSSADNIRNKYDCTYKPDAHPEVYWLCMEDHGADEDYKDVMIKVTANADGSVSLFITAGFTGHRNTLVSKEEGRDLLYVPSGFSGGTITFPGQGLETSYAMNVNAAAVSTRSSKILVLDYSGYLASNKDDWTDKKMDADQDGTLDFARHEGLVNVLFTDGSVVAMYPWEIDPALPSVARQFWDP